DDPVSPRVWFVRVLADPSSRSSLIWNLHADLFQCAAPHPQSRLRGCGGGGAAISSFHRMGSAAGTDALDRGLSDDPGRTLLLFAAADGTLDDLAGLRA